MSGANAGRGVSPHIMRPDDAFGRLRVFRAVGPSATRTSAFDVSGWSPRAVSDDGRAKAHCEVPRTLSGPAVAASSSDMLRANSRNRTATRGSGLDLWPLPYSSRHAVGS